MPSNNDNEMSLLREIAENTSGLGGSPGGGAVDSVNGQTGDVVLDKGDIGLANADNTSDANKPVSSATQTALNLKANLASPALTGTPTAPTAAAATDTTQVATTAFVHDAIADAGGDGDMLSVLTQAETDITTTVTLAVDRMFVATAAVIANFTATLPPVSGNAGRFVGVHCAIGFSFLLTIKGDGAETIDGVNTRIMWEGESAILLCNGTSWQKVAGKSRPMQVDTERAAALSIASATLTYVPMDTLIGESATGMYASGKVVAKRPGVYQIEAHGSVGYTSGAVGGVLTQLNLFINSESAETTAPPMMVSAPSIAVGGIHTYANLALTRTRSLAAGDYIAMAFRHDIGASVDTRTSAAVRPSLKMVEIVSW